MLGVLEDSFLAVDDAFGVAVGSVYVDESELFEFFEAVVDLVVFQGGVGGDFLDVVVAFLDLLEDCSVLVSKLVFEVGHSVRTHSWSSA